MKVVFLDIDGVLNTFNTTVEVAGYTFVEESKVALLQELVQRTGAKLVLTSTWREGWAMLEHPEEFPGVDWATVRLFEALRDTLQEYGMELLGYTPIFGHRGEEIDAWLRARDGEPVESLVVLDDLYGSELRPYSRFLVQTGMTKGLERKHVETAVTLLNGSA